MAGTFSFVWRSFLLVLLPFAVNSRVHLKVLSEETWQEMLVGEWMIEFFAPWCPACRQLEPIWKEFASWSEDLGIHVGSVDVTTNPGLSGRFAITALPTIYHVKEGMFRQYRGSKRKDELISFIEDGKWKDIEPIPTWKSPQSIQMSTLAYFFKFSMFLRNIHNDLVELGIPYWGSYIIFGLATIILGAILGLLIVYIIDHLCPAKKPLRESELHGESSKADEKGGGRKNSDKIPSIPEDEEKTEEEVNISRKDKGLKCDAVLGEKGDSADDAKLYNISEAEEKDVSSGSGEGKEDLDEDEKDVTSESDDEDEDDEERCTQATESIRFVNPMCEASDECVDEKEKDSSDELNIRKRMKSKSEEKEE